MDGVANTRVCILERFVCVGRNDELAVCGLDERKRSNDCVCNLGDDRIFCNGCTCIGLWREHFVKNAFDELLEATDDVNVLPCSTLEALVERDDSFLRIFCKFRFDIATEEFGRKCFQSRVFRIALEECGLHKAVCIVAEQSDKRVEDLDVTDFCFLIHFDCQSAVLEGCFDDIDAFVCQRCFCNSAVVFLVFEIELAAQRESKVAVKHKVVKSATDCGVDFGESCITFFVESKSVERDAFEVNRDFCVYDCFCRVVVSLDSH